MDRYIQLGDVQLTQSNYEPRGSKTFNVLKDYAWTASRLNEKILKDIPSVKLVEYELNLNAFWQSVKYWASLEALGNDGKIYESLYSANKTGVEYTIPYLNQNFWNASQTWNTEGFDMFNNANTNIVSKITKIGLKVDQAATTASQIFKAAGAQDRSQQTQENVTITNRFSWQGANMNPIDIVFPLFNTGGSNAEDVVGKNRELIQNLQISNLHSKYEKKYSSPPAIFSMEIKGQRVSPICVIKDINIENVGQINMVENESGIFPTPDAWIVKLTMQELVPQTRETLLAAINPDGTDRENITWKDKVQAIYS